MNPRLIPWCIAASAFLAAVAVFMAHGTSGDAGPMLPRTPGANLLPAVERQSAVPLSNQSDEFEAPEPAPRARVLPLPPATGPAPTPGVQPVPDDEPSVEDLPVRPNPAPHDEQ